MNDVEQMITSALRIAAVQYQADAAVCRDTPRLIEQFQQQAKNANELAESIEQRGLRRALANAL